MRDNGEPAKFVRAVLVRTWLFAALGAIPPVGKFVGLIDACTIFQPGRRCLHDRVAGTMVIAV